MFASRPPIRRICEIHTAIRRGSYPNATTMAHRFEVHRRTVVRDIEYMRDQLGAPLAYDAKKRGYYYTEPNYSLPIIQTTEGEVFALFLAERVLRQYKGTPYQAQLESAFAKLVRQLPDEVSIDLEASTGVFSFDMRAVLSFDPEVLKSLTEAARRKLGIRITYKSPWSGKATEREVDPYRLANIQGRWYLIGYCHLRGDIRMFTPSWIQRVELTNRTFQIPRDFQPETLLESSFGVMTGKGLFNVKLKFNAKLAGFIKETVWHHSQKIRELLDGGIILAMRLSDLKEVKRWVLSWGENVEVLSPKKLREGVVNTLGEMRNMYL